MIDNDIDIRCMPLFARIVVYNVYQGIQRISNNDNIICLKIIFLTDLFADKI